MIFGQTDSICTPRPDVSRAGSDTVVTLLGMAPTAPSYQETIHPPTRGKFLQQASWVRGRDLRRGQGRLAATLGGGSNSWDTCLDTPFMPHKYVQ